jgi:hypothetical protein
MPKIMKRLADVIREIRSTDRFAQTVSTNLKGK